MATYTITLNERTTSGKAIKKSAMRHLCSKLLLTALISMLCATSFAHDIAVANTDGVTIYYNFTNNNTELAVTYQGSSYSEYDEYSGNVVIPKTVTYSGNTYSVTSIANRAFAGCTRLTSVTIPNSVTNIDQETFYDCSVLTSVTIPNSVTTIGSAAFGKCSGLVSITIPNSVTSIDSRTFIDCTCLTSITIPSGVTSIEPSAFSGCSGLTSIVVENGNTVYDSRNDCNAIIETATNTLVVGCKNTNIPNSVTIIGNYAFEGCSGLTNLTIPNSVTSIHQYAFRDCSSLTSVTIPNSVTGISRNAFQNCSSLTSVTIPDGVTTIYQYTFSGCTSLTSVTIPNSVTNIGNSAFRGCSSLTSVTIGNSVTSIGEHAFRDCDVLSSVIIPNSVTSIGRQAFQICNRLTSFKVSWENPLSISAIFAGSNTNAILYVPKGSKEAYETANYWKEFKEIVEYDPVIVLDENSEDGPEGYGVPMDVKVLRTIKGGEWNTICLPFAMTGEQVSEAFGSVELADFSDYQVGKSGDKTISIMINFTPVSAADGMEANHPYLIRTADDIDEFTVSEVMLVPDEENAQKVFSVTEDGQTVSKGYMKGIYHAQTVVPADNLFVSANKFYYSTGKTKMMAYRAYFYLADRLDRNESAAAKISFMFNESSTDGIEGVKVRPAASSAIFDIQGRKVADSADGLQGLPKGIYIINGKKVVR